MVRSRMHRNKTARMHKLGLFQLFGLAALGAALVCVGSSAESGYLPGVGPTPLRFRPLPTARNAQAVLPPLATTDQSTNAPTELPENLQTNSPVPDWSDPAFFIGPELPPVLTNAPAAPQIMVPQMLMRFFGPATNQETIISAPVEFMPPGPPISRGSSATYISH
jgi:hypothetical protein